MKVLYFMKTSLLSEAFPPSYSEEVQLSPEGEDLVSIYAFFKSHNPSNTVTEAKKTASSQEVVADTVSKDEKKSKKKEKREKLDDAEIQVAEEVVEAVTKPASKGEKKKKASSIQEAAPVLVVPVRIL